jgi:hypothetical protein
MPMARIKVSSLKTSRPWDEFHQEFTMVSWQQWWKIH